MPSAGEVAQTVMMVGVWVLAILLVLGTLGVYMSVRNIETHAGAVSAIKRFAREYHRDALPATELSDNDICRSVTGRDIDQEDIDNRSSHDDIFEEFESLTPVKRREIFDLLYTNGFGGPRKSYVHDDKEDRIHYPEMNTIFEEIDHRRTSTAAAGSEPSYDDRKLETIEQAVQRFIAEQGETVFEKVVKSNDDIQSSVQLNTTAVTNSQNAIVAAVTAAGNPIAPGTFPELMETKVENVVIPVAWALTADELQIIEDMKAFGTGEEALMVYNTAFALGVKYLEDGDIATRPGVFLKNAIQAGLTYYGVSDSGGNVILPSSAYGKVVEILLSRFIANR